ncbi:Cuticular protein 67Fb [Daphnia magna]|uniref:Cuticular protein 67Fb n=1 Tax=Daphnia magna TaxID=35525 RepID=A0A164PIV5_9CRUS|nr:Cuticular protein 67Fb [Daphnia magna]
MKFIIALAFLAVAIAAPQGDKKPIEIISSNSEMNADGSYSFAHSSIYISDKESQSNEMPSSEPFPEEQQDIPKLAKMKFIIALAFLAVAIAAPQGDKKPIEIISSNSEMNADGSYSFAFESEDGTKVQESGNQKQVGPKPEDIGTVSKGSYSFTTPDGVVLTVNWVADENGFQATGNHLPTPPPMPEHVVKMLADFKAAGVL